MFILLFELFFWFTYFFWFLLFGWLKLLFVAMNKLLKRCQLLVYILCGVKWTCCELRSSTINWIMGIGFLITDTYLQRRKHDTYAPKHAAIWSFPQLCKVINCSKVSSENEEMNQHLVATHHPPCSCQPFIHLSALLFSFQQFIQINCLSY